MRQFWRRFLRKPDVLPIGVAPSASTLLATVRFARDHGARQIGLAFDGNLPALLGDSRLLAELGVTALLDVAVRDSASTSPDRVPIWSLPTALAEECLDTV